jgi:hypothetical protein
MWRCRDDESFDFVARFLLRGGRRPCGVAWRRGKGVAGWLWDHGVEKKAAYEKLVNRNRMRQATFEGLPAEERLGLSWAEWRSASEFTGVIAVRQGGGLGARPLGFLVVDYTGDLTKYAGVPDQIDEMNTALKTDGWLLELQEALTDRVAKL